MHNGEFRDDSCDDEELRDICDVGRDEEGTFG